MNLFDEVCEMTLRVMCVSLSGFEITCENCYINFIVKKAAKIVTLVKDQLDRIVYSRVCFLSFRCP